MLTMVSAVTHHLSPYNIIMVLLTRFPMLHFIYRTLFLVVFSGSAFFLSVIALGPVAEKHHPHTDDF